MLIHLPYCHFVKQNHTMLPIASSCYGGKSMHDCLLLESCPIYKCIPPTSLLCLEPTYCIYGPKYGTHCCNSEMNIHAEIKSK